VLYFGLAGMKEDGGLRSLTVAQGRLEWRIGWRSALLASKRVAHGLRSWFAGRSRATSQADGDVYSFGSSAIILFCQCRPAVATTTKQAASNTAIVPKMDAGKPNLFTHMLPSWARP